MLRQGREQREAHLAHAAHKRFLLHLHTLMLKEVRGLAEDLHTLRALEGPILSHHALVFMGISQVRDIMTTGATLVPSVCSHLQGGLLGLHSMLLQGGIWLQDHSIHSTAERLVSPRGKRVHHGRWSHCVLLLLLPRLRHIQNLYARFKSSGDR